MTQLAFANHRGHVQTVIQAVLAAAEPGQALVRAWPKDEALAAKLRRGVLVAAGKASMAMAQAAVEQCAVRPSLGVVTAAPGSKLPPSMQAAGGGIRLFEADHPLPSQRNLIGAQAAADAARLASSRALPLVALISGGASAHLTVPERGLTLSDIRIITEALLRAGAPIAELNCVRSCAEQLKAGGLARLAAPSPVFAFILSDVIGDPVDVIASGLTADVRLSYAEALRVLEARRLLDLVPNLTAHLKARVASPPLRPAVTNATNTIIGSNALAVEAARAALEQSGFVVAQTRSLVEGEARTRGEEFAARLLEVQAEAAADSRPRAIVWGGETTVSVRGPATSFGGRDQEAALAAAIRIAGRRSVAAAFFATDGVDGLTPPGKPPHAGALITGDTVAAAGRGQVDVAGLLGTHDSYRFAEVSAAALRTGPTGTNVNDIWVGMAY